MSEVTLVEKEEFEGFIQKLSKSLNTFQVQVLTEEQHTFNIKELYRFQYIPSKGIAIQIINSFSWFKIIYLYLKCNKWYGSFLFIYKSILFKQYCFYIQGFNRFSPGMIFVGEHQLMIVEKNKTHVYQCVVLGGDKEVFQNDLNTRLWLLSNTLVNIHSIIELDRDQCFFVSSWIQGRLVQSIRKLSQPQQINLWQQLATVYKSKPLFQQHIDAF